MSGNNTVASEQPFADEERVPYHILRDSDPALNNSEFTRNRLAARTGPFRFVHAEKFQLLFAAIEYRARSDGGCARAFLSPEPANASSPLPLWLRYHVARLAGLARIHFLNSSDLCWDTINDMMHRRRLLFCFFDVFLFRNQLICGIV